MVTIGHGVGEVADKIGEYARRFPYVHSSQFYTSVAAGLAVQRYIEKHNLIDRARDRGAYLAQRLERLRVLPSVGDIRGKGLLQTIEFVAHRATRAACAPEQRFSERLFEALRDRGVLVYPMRGTVDGVSGDHILLAPPFIIEEKHIDLLVDEIERALAQVTLR